MIRNGSSILVKEVRTKLIVIYRLTGTGTKKKKYFLGISTNKIVKVLIDKTERCFWVL